MLVRACVAAGLAVEVLPGPSAAIAALVASALPADSWRFVGFLPRKKGELTRVLAEPGATLVAFESPRRVPATLAVLAEIDPARESAVCRELTKAHEEIVRGTASELAARYVSGYLYDPTLAGDNAASHAWVDVWDEERGWIALDPTHDREQTESYVRVAVGRDYEDVPPTRGVYKGAANEVLPFFARLEDDPAMQGQPHHGRGGPLPIHRARLQDWGPIDRATRDAALALLFARISWVFQAARRLFSAAFSACSRWRPLPASGSASPACRRRRNGSRYFHGARFRCG